ncbi:AIPR family protein [Streptomyces virginiae]|uniref:AIPR family protein n=1 Tax=Streptomyces virginiae TaxID=1961 RepID=UPI0022544D9F|nr:AIPR family protein [Streptomyces virginiae]MCX4720022.1 AIPR family protein [Streptomyces virginiae]
MNRIEGPESAGQSGIERVRADLRHGYGSLISLDDASNRPPRERDLIFASRALAAKSVEILTGCSTVEAAAAVTDGLNDHGIDAIGFSPSAPELWLIQSKWSDRGTARFRTDDALKLIHGLRTLDNLEFDRFNMRIQGLADRVRQVLESPACQVHLVAAVLGDGAPAEHVREVLDQAAVEFGGVVDYRVLTLADFSAAARRGAPLAPAVDLLATMTEGWYSFETPYRAYSGTVPAEELAGWYRDHGSLLFERNIRDSLGLTRVSMGLVDTLQKSPESFWYFHNGITVVCRSIAPEFFMRRTVAAPVRLRLTDALVVNGAQTVASVYRAYEQDPHNVSRANVAVRIISVSDAPESFTDRISVATHTQHHVEPRDLIALDKVQSRIREDFAFSLDKEYVFRRGELEPAPAAGCSIVEAAVALACGHPDPALTARVNVSTDHLWETTPQGAYTRLFGRRPSAHQIWRSVLLLRTVRGALHEIGSLLQGRAASIADRGSLLIAHIVFRLIDDEAIDEAESDWERMLEDVPARVKQVLPLLVNLVDLHFGHSSFISATFREEQRCTVLAAAVLRALRDEIDLPEPVTLAETPTPPRRRRPTSVRLLVDHDRIPEGARVMYQPGQVEEEAIGHWLDEDPNRYLATWTNDSRRPLRWAADGQHYSANGLIRHIWESARWIDAWSAVRGARYWVLPGEGTLADLAEELWQRSSASESRPPSGSTD